MTEPSPYPIQSERHALLTGMVFGLASKHGLVIHPEIDEDGNWAASAMLELPESVTLTGISVRIVVTADDLPEAKP